MFDPLMAVVCGFENSGTTLIGAVLRSHPDVDSGFEGGFLLGDSPRMFPYIHPHYGFFLKCWEVTPADVAHICDTDDWSECYRRARQLAPIIANKQTKIFDKTPAYMKHLKAVLNRVPGVPCVVIVRDPRALLTSWAKRTGFDEKVERWVERKLPQLCKRYVEYARGYAEAAASHSVIQLVQFEDVCIDPIGQFTRLFEFLGLTFDPSYMNFGETYGVHGTGISQEFLYPYRERFSAQICDEILSRTSEFADWHFSEQQDRRAA